MTRIRSRILQAFSSCFVLFLSARYHSVPDFLSVTTFLRFRISLHVGRSRLASRFRLGKLAGFFLSHLVNILSVLLDKYHRYGSSIVPNIDCHCCILDDIWRYTLQQCQLSKHELATISARAERHIGTQGGGMDQAIAFLGKAGNCN